MAWLRHALAALAGNIKGATAIEYCFIAALIAVALYAALGTLGNSVQKPLTNVSTKMNSAVP